MHSALMEAERRALEQLRIPTNGNGGPMHADVAVVQDDRGFAYRVHFGPKRMGWWIGPAYDYPREAEAFAAQINERIESEVVPDPA